MADLTPHNATNETSKSLDSLVRKWLFVLAKMYQFDVPPSIEGVPSLADLWLSSLRDLRPELVQVAFELLMQTWKPDYGRKFPASADLRSLLDDAREVLEDRQRKQAWLTKDGKDIAHLALEHFSRPPEDPSNLLPPEEAKVAFERLRKNMQTVSPRPAQVPAVLIMTEEELAAKKAQVKKDIADWEERRRKNKEGFENGDR